MDHFLSYSQCQRLQKASGGISVFSCVLEEIQVYLNTAVEHDLA